MSVVTVTSDGHVDVDWQDQVPCPKCGEPISCLRYSWPNIAYGDFFITDGSGDWQQDDDECTGDTKFYCPVCDSLLFDDEEEAERFLLSLSWEPDVLPMPLRDENNLRTWTDEELKEEYLGLYDVIEVADCYSSSDYANYLAIEAELEMRGIAVMTRVEFKED